MTNLPSAPSASYILPAATIESAASYAYVTARFRGGESQEDYSQQAWLIAHRVIHQYNPHLGKLDSWLHSIIVYRLRDWIRTSYQTRRNVRVSSFESVFEEAIASADARSLRSHRERGTRQMRREQVNDAIAHLTACSWAGRLLVRLIYFEGMTRSEAASVLGLDAAQSIKILRAHLRRIGLRMRHDDPRLPDVQVSLRWQKEPRNVSVV